MKYFPRKEEHTCANIKHPRQHKCYIGTLGLSQVNIEAQGPLWAKMIREGIRKAGTFELRLNE